MITVIIMEVKATLENGKWKCKDRIMKSILDTFSYEDLEYYNPIPDIALAELAVKELGGEIIKITDIPKFKEGRVY